MKKRSLFWGFVCLTVTNSSLAENCTDVLKLTSKTSNTIQNEKEFLEEASAFCDEYSKNSGSSNADGLSVGYGGFSLGRTSANSDAKSIAKSLCKSSDLSELRDNAYSTYLNELSPQAKSIYQACVDAKSALKIQSVTGSAVEARIRVSFDTSNNGEKANIIIAPSSGVSCMWGYPDLSTDKPLEMSNGQSRYLNCKRTDFGTSGSIAILNDKSAATNAEVVIPWSAYTGKSGVPIDIANQYQASIKEFEEIKAQLKGAVIAFNKKCPQGYSRFSKADGRFIRGIDDGNTVDPEGPRKLGSIQDDAFEKHRHGLKDSGKADWEESKYRSAQRVGDGSEGVGFYTSYAGEEHTETRPKNVALYYCEKD